MNNLIDVIYVTSQVSRFKAREFAEQHPELKVIEKISGGGKNPKHNRSKFIFVRVVPKGEVCLDRVRRVHKSLIKEVME